MGSNEHGITNAQWMLGAASQHGLLHDQNIRTDHYRAEISTDNSTGQNSRSWADCHVTGQHGGWCYPGRGIDHSGHPPRVTNDRVASTAVDEGLVYLSEMNSGLWIVRRTDT